MTRILIIQGHPHSGHGHFCEALAEAYAAGARSRGHEVQWLDLASLDFQPMADPADFLTPPPGPILEAQRLIQGCQHLVVVYPLWLGTMPSIVKAFFEQVARNQFVIKAAGRGFPEPQLKGRSARVIVTMGMPAMAYRLMFGAHGVKGFESAILGMAGFGPVRDSLIGGVEASPKARTRWLDRMARYGAEAS